MPDKKYYYLDSEVLKNKLAIMNKLEVYRKQSKQAVFFMW